MGFCIWNIHLESTVCEAPPHLATVWYNNSTNLVIVGALIETTSDACVQTKCA